MAEVQEQKASLAFTFQKKKVVQKIAVNVEDRKDGGQLISGFDGARAQVVGGDAAADGSKTYVIPKLENTFKTGVGPKKFTPSWKPPSSDVVKLQDGEDKFVQAESTVPTITEYGLQLRDMKQEDRVPAEGAANGPAQRNITAAVLEERAYRESVEELPDVADEEAYEAMPVEEFGRAMLRGMGWEDGMGVGRNRRKVDAIEYVRRPERLGLGALPVPVGEDPKKPVKMGDKPRKQDLVVAPDADGRQRNIRTLDEQLVPRSTVLPGPQPGKVMRIMAGPHGGLGCTALEALPKVEGRPERWRVRLTASQEEVDVLASELGERWEKEPPPPLQQQPRNQQGEAAGARASGRQSAEREREREHGGSGEPERGRGGSRDGAGPSTRRRGANEDPGDGDGRRDSERQRRRGERDGEGERDRDRGRDRDRDEDRGRYRDDEDGGGDGSKRRRRDREEYDGERRGGYEDGGREGGKKTRGSDRDPDEDYQDGDRDPDDDKRHGKKHKHEKKKDKHDKHDKHDAEGHRRHHHKHKHKHSSSRDVRESGSDSEDEGAGGDGGRRNGRTWLLPHIKVRIVDKAVRGGKLYLKKGTVVDVHPGGSADVAVDDTGDVLRLSEAALETVVPKHQGAAVLVVAGPHRGARGRLLQASTSAGAAAVQLAADFSIVRLMLDDVAGYAGELEDE